MYWDEGLFGQYLPELLIPPFKFAGLTLVNIFDRIKSGRKSYKNEGFSLLTKWVELV